MIGPFLIIIAVGLFYVANKGKSWEFLQALDVFPGLTAEEQKLGNFIGTWVKTNVWDNLINSIINATPKVSVNAGPVSVNVNPAKQVTPDNTPGVT